MTDLPTKGQFIGPVAVVDGYVLKAPPFELWEKKGEHSDVPFLVGTTEQEADFAWVHLIQFLHIQLVLRWVSTSVLCFLHSPPSTNISQWTWGDYTWFVTGNGFKEGVTQFFFCRCLLNASHASNHGATVLEEMTAIRILSVCVCDCVCSKYGCVTL